MKKHERAGGFFWLILGICICTASFKLGMGDLHRPGPGFMPFLAGALLGVCGIVLLASTIFNEEKKITPGKAVEKKNWKMILYTLVALFCYALLLQPVGFYTTTTLFLFFLFKLSTPKKWIAPLTSTAITVSVSYIIFSLLLKIQFPGGIIGF
jgi:hypothetical protein